MWAVPAYVQPPIPKDVEMAIEAFGNRVRVAIMAHLATVPAATSREVADALGLDIRPAQRHLWALQRFGLVVDDQPQGDRRGSIPRYSLDHERVQTLYRHLGSHLGVD